MTGKKYELTNETIDFEGRTLYRIRALKSFRFAPEVNEGDLGGYVEGEHNLAQAGNCWIYDDAIACDGSYLSGDSYLCGNSIIKDEAKLYDEASLHDSAILCDEAIAKNFATITGRAKVSGEAHIGGEVFVGNDTRISEDISICNNAVFLYNSNITSNKDYLVVGPIGSRYDHITFAKTANGDIVVSFLGAVFRGTIDKFEEFIFKNRKSESFKNNGFSYEELSLYVSAAKLHILK